MYVLRWPFECHLTEVPSVVPFQLSRVDFVCVICAPPFPRVQSSQDSVASVLPFVRLIVFRILSVHEYRCVAFVYSACSVCSVLLYSVYVRCLVPMQPDGVRFFETDVFEFGG